MFLLPRGFLSCYPYDAKWSICGSSTGRPSGSTALQFDMLSGASVISPIDGLCPGNGRGGKISMIVGSRCSEFVFKGLWYNPTNRNIICQKRAILVPNEPLAPRSSSFQPHRTLEVLQVSALIVIRKEPFGFRPGTSRNTDAIMRQ